MRGVRTFSHGHSCMRQIPWEHGDVRILRNDRQEPVCPFSDTPDNAMRYQFFTLGLRNLRGFRAVVTAITFPPVEWSIMSLPLTRRIARAALLVAAGAAAGVGAAGSASAAPSLPATPNLGGLTALDGANVGNTADGAAQTVTGAVGHTGGKAVESAVPAAGKTGGKAVKKVAPVVQRTAGDTVGSAGGLLGDTASTATKGGLPTDGLAKGGLPVKGLPIGS